MSVKNLQQCVGDLEAAGRLIRIEQPVDPHLEAAEIQRRVFANNGPAPINEGPKDTFSNIKSNKEFVVNISTYESKEKMNQTCSPLAKGESEVDLGLLETTQSKLVKPKSLKASPINMECKLYKILDLPVLKENEYNGIIIGKVIGININDDYIKDGIIDVKKLKPLARLGYMDYTVVDDFFRINRPS